MNKPRQTAGLIVIIEGVDGVSTTPNEVFGRDFSWNVCRLVDFCVPLCPNHTRLKIMKKSILTIGLLSVTLSLVAACAQRPKTVEADVDKTEVQQVEDVQADLAPDFELPDLQGNPLKLSSLRGKYVVLDFWGSWCIWCIRGIPRMKEAYSKYKDKMEILGVDCQDTEEKWKAAVEEHQLPWLQVRCPEDYLQTLGQQYGIQGFPTKVIIDPEGRLVKVVVGEDPAFYTFLDQLFAK